MAIETYKLASSAVRYRATAYIENHTWTRENNLMTSPPSYSSPSSASEPEN